MRHCVALRSTNNKRKYEKNKKITFYKWINENFNGEFIICPCGLGTYFRLLVSDCGLFFKI